MILKCNSVIFGLYLVDGFRDIYFKLCFFIALDNDLFVIFFLSIIVGLNLPMILESSKEIIKKVTQVVGIGVVSGLTRSAVDKVVSSGSNTGSNTTSGSGGTNSNNSGSSSNTSGSSTNSSGETKTS